MVLVSNLLQILSLHSRRTSQCQTGDQTGLLRESMSTEGFLVCCGVNVCLNLFSWASNSNDSFVFVEVSYYVTDLKRHFQQLYKFLFYQEFYVVLLSPCELDATLKMILQVPLWAARVIYIQGSALKDADLSRCR